MEQVKSGKGIIGVMPSGLEANDRAYCPSTIDKVQRSTEQSRKCVC